MTDPLIFHDNPEEVQRHRMPMALSADPEPETPPFIIDYVDALPSNEESRWYPYATRPLSQISAIVIHHSAGRPTTPPESINIGHMNRNGGGVEGWPRIGYTFYIRGDGTIYKTNLLTAHSFHAGEYGNPVGIGVCLAGHLSNHQPSAEQLQATRQLVAWLRQELGPLMLKRHLDYMPTQCPGNTQPDWFATLDVQPSPLSHVVTVNLMPQDISLAQVGRVLELTYSRRQTMVYSADDAAWLAASGAFGSRVVVWGKERWQDDIVSWLLGKGVKIVETMELGTG